LTNLRRALERDRFGIVAQVLAARDGCTPTQCDAFAMLRDARRVRANMAERRYASMIERHVAGWAPADRPVAAHAPPALSEAPATAGDASAKDR
jgi:hypothetical protein